MSDSKQKFDRVILGLAKIFRAKNEQYGDSAFDIGTHPSTKWWLRLSDIRRKTTRLEQLTADAAAGNVQSKDKLIDDYKDLAIYAIIAVAVLEDS